MAYTDCIIHDADALSDTKIQRLIASKGCSAYAVYWAILESMRKNEGNFSLEDCDIIAHQLWSSADIVIDIVNACVEFGLFIRGDDNSLQSVRLNEDIANVKRKREEFSKGGKKRWQNTENEPSLSLVQAKHEPSLSQAKHARAFSCSSSCSSSDSSSCSKIDKENLLSNDKEMKEKNGSLACDAQLDSSTPTTRKKSRRRSERCQIPTLEEVTSYAESIGSKIDPEEFIVFYNSKNWKVGKDVMTDWHSAVRGWEIRRKKAEKAKAEAEAKRAEAESKKRTAGYISDFVPATKEELDGF